MYNKPDSGYQAQQKLKKKKQTQNSSYFPWSSKNNACDLWFLFCRCAGGESFPKSHLLLWSHSYKNITFCLYLNAVRPPTLSVLLELWNNSGDWVLFLSGKFYRQAIHVYLHMLTI